MSDDQSSSPGEPLSTRSARRLPSLLRDLIATSPDAISIGHGGKLFAVNAAFLALFGYDDASEVVGRPATDLVAPADRALIRDRARRRELGEDLPPVFRCRGLTRAGDEIEVQVRSTVYVIEGETYVVVSQSPVGTALTIPDEDHDLYHALFAHNAAIKLLIDPQTGLIVDANEAAIAFYGWPLEELRKKRINEINTLTDDEVQQEMRNAASGHRRCFRFRHRTARNEIRHVDVYSGPVSFGDRRLLLSIIHDVTDREALRLQLRQAQQLEAVGRLAGTVAHEFNNLLTVMLGAWSMLERSIDANDAARRFVDDLGFSTERAVELSRGLLAFSRRQVLQPRALDLNHVVDDLVALLQRSLGASITIELDLDDAIPESLLDPRQIETVLMNLVLNAADAMPNGGTVTIRSRVCQRANQDGAVVPWLQLVVADDGEGMDDETLARVFEPFFSTKGPGRGTGLGLSTVRGIIEQVGGRIEVASRAGQGTEFEVLLPVVEAPVTPPDDLPLPPPKRAPRILLVEDNDPVRRALSQGLSHLGFQVIALGSAEEARVADWSQIDALVTDVALPGMSGATLAAEAVATSSLPTIIISGDLHRHDLSGLPDRVIRLEKPITPSELAKAIGRAMAAAPTRSGGST